jgi:hypothetical protein
MRLEVLTANIMIFWDATPCNLVERYFFCPENGGSRFLRNVSTHLFLCQRVNTATTSPADDVHHYVISQKLLLINRFCFQQTSGVHAPVGKRKGCSLSGRSPAPIADSFHVATMARKHSVLNLREINRSNTHTALASVLTYYGWVSLIL